MTLTKLGHDVTAGEVSPRSYHLLGCVRLHCDEMGSHLRTCQLRRIIGEVDRICTELGQSRTRLHFTLDPQVSAQKSVEVRLQPLSFADEGPSELFCEAVGKRWQEVIDLGAKGGWSAA